MPSFFWFFSIFAASKHLTKMKQRVQSILFFLSAVAFGLLFFMPIASYLDVAGSYYKLFAYGVNTISLAEGVSLPFSGLYALPLLILTVAVLLINFYIAFSIFRAVKLNQFVQLFKLSRINMGIAVVLIATIFVYYLFNTGKPIAAAPSFQWPCWGAFLTLLGLLMMLVASTGLKKDIDKVRSVDRIR